VQQNHVSQRGYQGFGGDVWIRLGIPFTFGGRTATIPFFEGSTQRNFFMDEKGRWAAHTRPLNIFILGGSTITGDSGKKIEWYRCPSDKGYPRETKATIVECERENRERPMYSMLGSSYRTNFAGWANEFRVGLYSVAGWGHRVSTLNHTGRLALFSEPLFYAMSFPGNRIDNSTSIRGWHGKYQRDNVGYADGSARYTQCGPLVKFLDADLRKMNVDNWFMGENQTYAIRRGVNWQMDNYPTALACMPMKDDNGRDSLIRPGKPGYSFGAWDKWPNLGYQDNCRGSDK
jgi:hypothetical protein